MPSMRDYYDRVYHGENPYWGLSPSSLAVRLAERLTLGVRILDLGSGEGRNALFLAAKGFVVTAVRLFRNRY